MDQVSAIWEIFQKAPQLVIGGVLVFAALKFRRYDKHLKECEETPKKTIVEKIDALSTSVGHLATNQEEMGKQLNILVGRQIERDKAQA